MSNQQKHTATAPATPPPPSAGWDESSAFRQTFLRHFTQTEDSSALHHIGTMLHEMALEFARYWPDDGRSATRAEVSAAAADVRHIEGFLRSVGRERELSELSADDQALAELADRLATELGRLAEMLERAVK